MSESPTDPSSQRYALVTGAGSGLGRALCLRLASQGWHVGVADMDLVAAERTNAELTKYGGTGQVELLDVTSREGWQRLSARLREEWPRLDLLVNNAGICGAGEIGGESLEHFDKIVDVNFHGTLNGCQSMIPWLKENTRGGHIVNVASIFGLVAPPGMAAYNCSKAAVVALSETLYGELRAQRVGVTIVASGFFASNLISNGRYESDAQREVAEQYVRDATITAEYVADRTLAAVQRDKLYVVLGRKPRWIWRIKRWLPARFARMIAWRYRRKIETVDDTN